MQAGDILYADGWPKWRVRAVVSTDGLRGDVYAAILEVEANELGVFRSSIVGWRGGDNLPKGAGLCRPHQLMHAAWGVRQHSDL